MNRLHSLSYELVRKAIRSTIGARRNVEYPVEHGCYRSNIPSASRSMHCGCYNAACCAIDQLHPPALELGGHVSILLVTS